MGEIKRAVIEHASATTNSEYAKSFYRTQSLEHQNGCQRSFINSCHMHKLEWISIYASLGAEDTTPQVQSDSRPEPTLAKRTL